MLQQTLSHTPFYVWAILSFLLYRGVAASKDRVLSYRSAFIIPCVMLVLSWQSVARGFGLESPSGVAWCGGVLIGAALAWVRCAQVIVDRAAGTVMQRGSWMPLTLMMAIFCSKYAVAVALAMQPALSGNLRFALPVCLGFGLFSGVFLGRLLRTVVAWNAGRSAAIA
ncbi:hypothetical protein MJ904_24400 [Massilia sp. MB5]|uniref:DUF6622 family protein n=1 Tax=unclassified Massilia TaxID=2609279 RepID=UPI00067A94A9|nr:MULTISPECIES: DUF6622 family protein [unclassified Massilia]AKU20446.1 hypothetical protein ACZ75_01810 [Massilia sp. NR 4-1]UMR30115.1 hypothetical protein MJ904_24400 [Massilia sp. MB5]